MSFTIRCELCGAVLGGSVNAGNSICTKCSDTQDISPNFVKPTHEPKKIIACPCGWTGEPRLVCPMCDMVREDLDPNTLDLPQTPSVGTDQFESSLSCYRCRCIITDGYYDVGRTSLATNPIRGHMMVACPCCYEAFHLNELEERQSLREVGPQPPYSEAHSCYVPEYYKESPSTTDDRTGITTDHMFRYNKELLKELNEEAPQKLRYDLIPPLAYREMAKGWTSGQSKYADDHWKQLTQTELIGKIKRHLEEYILGESIDEEMDCHHLAAVCNNVCMLLEKELEP